MEGRHYNLNGFYRSGEEMDFGNPSHPSSPFLFMQRFL